MPGMIKPRVVTSVLRQTLGNGATMAMLLQEDGALLSYVGATQQEAETTAAISSHAWSVLSGDKFVMFDCERGRLALYRVGNNIAVIGGDLDAAPGALKAKLQALESYLAQPLQQLSDEQ